jgi:prephenate dehydrogenase
MPTARRALIAGLGLIGGSIGIALRRAGWRVSFDDPNVSLDDARAAGAADDDDREGADITILAMPVDTALELVGRRPLALDRLESRQRLGQQPTVNSRLVTSVCSVMGPLRAAADAHHISFVAGHPLAGSEKRGLTAARGDLFSGKPWFVDRDEQLVADIIDACGARAERVSAEEHDRAVALTSHLPQLLSTALGALGDDERARFAGGGLRTFLRLAESDASVWMPVLAANREYVRAELERVVAIAQAILDGDAAAFERARQFVRRLA